MENIENYLEEIKNIASLLDRADQHIQDKDFKAHIAELLPINKKMAMLYRNLATSNIQENEIEKLEPYLGFLNKACLHHNWAYSDMTETERLGWMQNL